MTAPAGAEDDEVQVPDRSEVPRAGETGKVQPLLHAPDALCRDDEESPPEGGAPDQALSRQAGTAAAEQTWEESFAARRWEREQRRRARFRRWRRAAAWVAFWAAVAASVWVILR